MAHPEVTKDYTSASGADTTSFSATAPARWIACYGSGSVTMLDNSATPQSVTFTVSGGEVIPGEWTAFTSTTCSRIRIASTNAQPTLPLSGAVNLGGGLNSVTGILPAASYYPWADAGTFYTTAFSPAVNTLHPYNFQTQTVSISFPKITAAIDGMSIGLANHGTGATVSMLFPSGSDSIGLVANGVTAATAAGPTSLKAQRYSAVLTTGQWVPGV